MYTLGKVLFWGCFLISFQNVIRYNVLFQREFRSLFYFQLVPLLFYTPKKINKKNGSIPILGVCVFLPHE